MADGPAGFTQGSTCPALLRMTLGFRTVRVRGCHPLWPDFPDRSAPEPSCRCRAPTTPDVPEHGGFGLLPVRSPLLGESQLFSLPPGTKMFQFPGFAPVLVHGWQASSLPGCPIRKSADRRLPAPPRGLSQLATSFIAFQSLGIRRPPFVSFAAPDISVRHLTSGFGQFRSLVSILVLVLRNPRHEQALHAGSLVSCSMMSMTEGGILFPRCEWRITDSNR